MARRSHDSASHSSTASAALAIHGEASPAARRGPSKRGTCSSLLEDRRGGCVALREPSANASRRTSTARGGSGPAARRERPRRPPTRRRRGGSAALAAPSASKCVSRARASRSSGSRRLAASTSSRPASPPRLPRAICPGAAAPGRRRARRAAPLDCDVSSPSAASSAPASRLAAPRAGAEHAGGLGRQRRLRVRGRRLPRPGRRAPALGRPSARAPRRRPRRVRRSLGACHARRSGSISGSVTAASARCTSCRSSKDAER